MKQLFRIDPYPDSNNKQAGDQISFTFPLGVFDLSTLRLWFTATMNGSANNQSLPRDVETLIETIEVFVNDVKVQHTNYYNQLVRTLLDYDRKEDEVVQRTYLSNSMWINNGLGSTLNTVGGLFCMNKWFGFLGSDALINTKLMGPVRVLLTFAPNAVLLSNITNATYSLSDVHMTVAEMHDDDYTPTSIEFDNFQSIIQYNNSFTQTTQMLVKSRHIDYVLATFLPPDYRSRAIANTTTDNGTSYYFTHGPGAPPNLAFPNIGWNFKINSLPALRYYPSQFASIEYMNMLFPETGSIATTLPNRLGTFVTLAQFQINRNLWVTGIELDMPANEGKDITFETNISANQTTNVATTNYTLLFVKCDSLLEYDSTSGRFNFVT